ncbi:lasso peptide biosynthesis PqqD family chaperone [Streptomyces sp. NPDC050161]|uniref:lasso peptide biosynthesis PqqD family chaperone n=1 Tax=Streptomyces sp. NPDC050161 TaxID=3365604 RepID=UPI0037B2D263
MRLALGPDISTTDTDAGMVLLDERSGRYWQLNPTGALILRTLLNGGILQHAAAELADRYPALTPEQAGHDAAALLESLRTAGLVTRP